MFLFIFFHENKCFVFVNDNFSYCKRIGKRETVKFLNLIWFVRAHEMMSEVVENESRKFFSFFSWIKQIFSSFFLFLSFAHCSSNYKPTQVFSMLMLIIITIKSEAKSSITDVARSWNLKNGARIFIFSDGRRRTNNHNKCTGESKHRKMHLHAAKQNQRIIVKFTSLFISFFHFLCFVSLSWTFRTFLKRLRCHAQQQ